MNQLFHIFKKDSRFLRLESLLMLPLVSLYARFETSDLWPFAEPIIILLLAVVVWLVGRTIHSDAIAGSEQYWIARPYRWKSLLGAKLLFLAIFINAPILLSQIFIIISDRFPLSAVLPGLLWWHLLFFAAILLPVGALASLVSGTVPFIFSVLVISTIGFGIPMAFHELRERPETSIDWVRHSVPVIGLAVLGLSVLYRQYKYRSTSISRLVAGSAAAVTLTGYLCMPSSFALNFQRAVLHRSSVARDAWLSLVPRGPELIQNRRWRVIRVNLPLELNGFPPGVEVQPDALSVTLHWRDGRAFKGGPYDLVGVIRRASIEPIFDGVISIDPTLFAGEKGNNFSLHAVVDFTLFGDDESKKIRLSTIPQNTVAGVQCYQEMDQNRLLCRSIFRGPAESLSAKAGSEYLGPISGTRSYSPFPAALKFDLIEAHWLDMNQSQTDITISAKRALSHFRRQLELDNVKIRDFCIVEK